MRVDFRKIIIITIFLFLINFKVVNAEELPNVMSKNVLLVNLNDDSVLYEKNADDEVLIASLTKMMTTLVAVENIEDYNKKILLTKDMFSGLTSDLSVAGFKIGETVTYDDLLYGVILKSGADATNILGVTIGGSVDNYVKMMNDKAKELGMNNTLFENTIGIEGINHHSTARDLYKLLNYAYKNEKFKQVFTTYNYKTLNSSHDMYGPLKKIYDLDMKYVKGAKTGYTSDAGLCLASVAEYDNNRFILITIGAPTTNSLNHMKDSKYIYEYFFNNYENKKLLKPGKTIVKLKTEYDENYIIKSSNSISKYINKESKIEYKYEGKKILDRKVKKGDIVGKYSIIVNGEKIYIKDIKSPVTVNMPVRYFIVHNKVLLCCLCALLTISFVVLVNKKRIIYNNKNR